MTRATRFSIVTTATLVWMTAFVGAQTVTLHVVDRGENDASVAGADVRIRNAGGNQFGNGITDDEGNISFKGSVNQQVTLEYEKLGYIRRPEKITLTLRAGDNRVTGPLVRTAADRNYYVRVANRIDELTRAASASERPLVEASEMERIRALPQDAQLTVASTMSPITKPNSNDRLVFEDRAKSEGGKGEKGDRFGDASPRTGSGEKGSGGTNSGGDRGSSSDKGNRGDRR